MKGKYKHYKGKYYQVLGLVKHSETREDLVLYKALYDDPELGKEPMFVRPKEMFEGFVDGKRRFTLINHEHNPERVEQVIKFLKEIDKLKNVERKIHVSTLKRYESTAEHSWHLAMFAMLLHKEFPTLNITKMLKLSLVHDLVEIYAGDSMPFNPKEVAVKEEKELAAAKKLFSQLPTDLDTEFMSLFMEFEKKTSLEGRFVHTFDKLQAIMQCILTKGKPYTENGLVYADIDSYNRKFMEHDSVILSVYEKLLKEAVDEGYLR